MESKRFNPRPHMGGDKAVANVAAKKMMFQSTPPHGGRPTAGPPAHVAASFNPRPHMGGDFLIVFQLQINYVSIHAPTWGATNIYIL